jgi:tetratricopeptide (TPR) repeat protein
VSKRRVALLRSLGRYSEAITALNGLLDVSPTDTEAWAELAELYVSQGYYRQGIFALEEVLLIAPNAWNVSTNPALLPLCIDRRLNTGARCMRDSAKCNLLSRQSTEAQLALYQVPALISSIHFEGSAEV